MMAKGSVSKFSFDGLPHFHAGDINLIKNLLQTYQFFSDNPSFVEETAKIFSENLKTAVNVSVVELTQTTLEDFLKLGSEGTLTGLMRIEPSGKKALCVIDGLLAKLMVQETLAGKITADAVAKLELKPVTVLEEAVVQYILITSLSRFTTALKPRQFNLVFETVTREPKTSIAGAAASDSYVNIVLCLKAFGKDFYLKLLLPMATLGALGVLVNQGRSYENERLKQFGGFTLQLQLEAGEVTLMPSDIEQLSEGDIIMLDDSEVVMKKDLMTGLGKIRVTEASESGGFHVRLESFENGVNAILESAL